MRLVVEEVVADHYDSILIFSLINEGEEPWTEGVKAGSWNSSWSSARKWGSPTLSEDGRKLTYYVECSSDDNIYKDMQFNVVVNDLIIDKVYEEQIDINVGEMFQKYEIVINTIDYLKGNTERIPLKFNKISKKKVKDKDKIKVQLQMQDGSFVKLEPSQGVGKEKFMARYIPSKSEEIYIAESQVRALIINDEYIAMEIEQSFLPGAN